MQRLNHHHLYVFFVFTKNASFTKTAEELSIAQSAVTSQVKLLEEALGLELVDRSNPRRPELTEAGRKVAEYASLIFESSRELINWATNGALPKNRTVRIGAISGLSRNFQYEFIEPLIQQADLKFEVTTGDQEKLMKLLADHHLDVVLSSRNATPDNKLNFHSHVLKSSPLVFVISKEHGGRSKKTLESILKNVAIFIPGKHFEAKPELDAYLEQFKELQIAGEIDDTALLRVVAVKSGCVVALPEMGILNEIENKDVLVLSRLQKIEQRFYAITRQRRDPNPDVRFLIEKSQRNSR
ncbi:MAG TPA: LysR family transcriptional regulator [Bdellovibrio sp.]